MRNFLVVTEHPVERVLRVVIGLVGISLVFVGAEVRLGLVPVSFLCSLGLRASARSTTVLGISTCSRKVPS